MVEDEIDFDSRELCSDGNCTGVIGDDGRCRVCGTSKSGEPAGEAPSERAASSAASSAEGEAESHDDFADRQLCPDGNCTGILGSDGHCKVCGKSS